MYAYNKKKIVHILKELELIDIFQGSKSTFKKDVALLSTKNEKKKKKKRKRKRKKSSTSYSTSLSLLLFFPAK